MVACHAFRVAAFGRKFLKVAGKKKKVLIFKTCDVKDSTNDHEINSNLLPKQYF